MGHMEKSIRPLFLFLALFSILDFWLTDQLIIRTGGYEIESNPLLYHWMTHMNTSYAILIGKVVGLVALGGALTWAFTAAEYQLYRPRITTWIFGITLIQFSVTCLGTYMVFFL